MYTAGWKARAAASVLALSLTAAMGSTARAQSIWDPVLTNSNWYVTVPQLLAYAAPPDNFANPLPIGDQTLWAIGTSTNGVFSGTSSGTLVIGPITSISTLSISGQVAPNGEILMVFTPTSGPTTIGLGVMQEVGGVTTMEMQMITGTDVLVTHWAYMTPYDPATFTPPEPRVVPSNLSPQWAWTEGTPWRMVSPALFGTNAPGTFIITGYKSGYFWGIGLRPDGTTFSLLGSITPQGRVLFNITDASSQLLTLYGGIEGDPSTAEMLLGGYDSTGVFNGDITFTQVVQPYQEVAQASGTVSAIGAAEVLYAVAGTPDGLIGAMAPVTSVLNNLSGSALSGALSQTVPVLSGAAAQATANTQRMLGQVIANRLADVDAAPDSQVWVQPLGGAGRQSAVGGVPGYTMSGGGFATGADRAFGAGTRMGALFAFASTALDASTDTDTSSLAEGSANLESYVFGLYGAQELSPGLNLTFAANAGVVDTSTSRSISFMGSVAEGSYTSFVLGLGAGLHKSYAVSDALTLTPGVRLDYLTVSSGSYEESGAGPLDLSVDSDSYQELILSAELALRYRLTDSLDLTARGGAGYNTLDTASAVTASFAGGGDAFVTTGPNVSRWLFTGGVGLASPVTETFSLGINYDMQASDSGYFNQIGSVRLKMRV